MRKSPRVRLDATSYAQLRRQVLERDGWRCQYCGGCAELEIHHIQPRSRLGHDREENLVTVCAGCHRRLHWGR
ncbi:HNH endonuclease [Acidobacteriia bacterium AH_259_A11_L15]|nr:HNH endonuclease [Acidobacteriia bacterium AH_259_A11_L15]